MRLQGAMSESSGVGASSPTCISIIFFVGIIFSLQGSFLKRSKYEVDFVIFGNLLVKPELIWTKTHKSQWSLNYGVSSN